MERHVGLNPAWPADRVTLIRRAGEPAPVAKDAKDAEIARLTASLNALTASYDELIALNDARNDEIARLTDDRDEARRALIQAKQQRDKFWSQRDAARAEVEWLTHAYEVERDRANEHVADCQRAEAERARVVALECALKEAIELSAACIIHSKSAEEVVATVNHLTAILNARVPEVCAILESPHD